MLITSAGHAGLRYGILPQLLLLFMVREPREGFISFVVVLGRVTGLQLLEEM